MFLKNSKVLQILLISLVGFLFSLSLIEGALQTYYLLGDKQIFGIAPKRSTLKFFDDDIIGHSLVPNQVGWFVPHTKEYFTRVEVNSHGFPDIEHSYDKPEETIRVLFLGDSFVENTQVQLEARFFRQFERKIKEKTGKNIEVIAMGRGNTGTAVQYLMLKNYGLKYKPDYVIHMFLTANDVKNNSAVMQADPYLPYFNLDENGNLVEVSHQKHSERNLAGPKEFMKKLRTTELLLALRQNLRERKEHVAYGGYPLEYHVYDKQYSTEYKDAWNVTKKLIAESKNITEQTGAKYILVTLSNNEQLHKKVQQKIKDTYPEFQEDKIDFEKPDREIKQYCEELKLSCFYMLSYFQDYLKNNQDKTTHNFLEGHWNQTGTNLAAEFLANNLSPLFGDKEITED